MKTKKSSLLIVYHRQPFEEVVENGETVFRINKSPNGIVPSLKSFFGGIDPGAGAWVAWKQYDPEVGPDFERTIHIDDVNGGYTVSRLPLTADQVESFYHVTSKEALWPILHSFPWLFQYDNVDWETFREVNRLFAEAAAEQAEDDALIWVHDYNLWLVPQYLRALKPKAKIAFFHHTPFPGPDVFNVLPWRQEIIESLLKCDLVGFHIPRYARNFADVAVGLVEEAQLAEVARADPGLVAPGQALSDPEYPVRLRVGTRTVNISAAPVGANPALIRETLGRPDIEERRAQIAEEMGGRRLIMAVGRTDYTKGMKESLLAYERLLERRPELIGQVKLLVTSVRSASTMKVYEETQRGIESLVGRINGRFSTFDWTPAVLFSNAIPFEKLLAYYQAADVCMITPLRDGLNLVAKEFVAAKQGGPGVLVLSEFAGCAIELQDAVLTNPYSNRSMDKALDEALAMPVDQSAERMARMDEVVRRNDIGRWVDETFRQFGGLGFARAGMEAAAE